jgi:glycosyltransferase involved in cell wall biosynthesis
MATLAILVPNLCGGGAERAMLNLARGFSERGISVDLVLIQAEGAYLSQVPSNVRIVNLGKQRVLSSVFDLITYLKQERPNTLLATLPEPSILAIWARLLSGVSTRIVVNVQNNTSQEAENSSRFKDQMTRRLVSWFFPWADAIVAVSQGVAEDLKQMGLSHSQIHVIHNPVVTPELLARSQESIDHPWFASGEPPVILAVGRLTKQKDFPTLLNAFAQVRHHRSIRLMILGEGEDRSHLEALAKELDVAEDILLPGFAPNPFAYMAKASVFVLSSLFEGLPTVLIEAMAVGTPVVSTNCKSGPVEILDQGQFGALTTVGNVEELSQAILQTLDNPAKVQVLQQRAQEYSLQRSLDKYADVLQVEPITNNQGTVPYTAL